LGSKTFLPENMHENLTKCPNFTCSFARKINKTPEFYMIYARKKLTKCPNFTRFLPEKNSILPEFGGGGLPPLPPVSYAYAVIARVHPVHLMNTKARPYVRCVRYFSDNVRTVRVRYFSVR